MARHRHHFCTALKRAHHRAAGRGRREQHFRNIERGQHVPVPCAGAHVHHLACGGNRPLAHLCPAQRMDEQVRHEQQPLCPAPQLRRLLFYCHQLEQRVDGHDLIARCLIKRSGVHCAQRLLHHSGSAAVAVVHRVFQQGPVFVQQAKIHTPGIEADAVDRARLSQPCAHLIHQCGKVPAQVPVFFPRAILKTVHLFVGKRPCVVHRFDGPAAGRAEVKGKDSCFSAHCTTPFFRRIFA